MKIKCIITFIENPKGDIINADMKDYLKIGDIFWVFGIRFSNEMTYVYIFNNDHLFEVPLSFFEIICSNVPNEWAIKIWNKKEITLWPELFYQKDFLENFADREYEERKLFKNFRTKIERC